jgi:hypothetical protein
MVPKGWAPGPVAEGAQFMLPFLKIMVLKEYTAPHAHKHYVTITLLMPRLFVFTYFHVS